MKQHESLQSRHALHELLHERREVGVEEQRLRLRVLERVDDLLGRQAHVDRLQNRAEHRNREIAFLVAMAVPIHHGDDIAAVDAERLQNVRQLVHAPSELGVRVPAPVAADDLVAAAVVERRAQQLADVQRISVAFVSCERITQRHLFSPAGKPRRT